MDSSLICGFIPIKLRKILRAKKHKLWLVPDERKISQIFTDIRKIHIQKEGEKTEE